MGFTFPSSRDINIPSTWLFQGVCFPRRAFQTMMSQKSKYKGIIFLPFPSSLPKADKISAAVLVWRQLMIKAYKRKHFKFCQGNTDFSCLFCLAEIAFWHKGKKVKWDLYVLLPMKGKGENPGPSASLPLGIHSSWNYCQRKSPTHYCGRHPKTPPVWRMPVSKDGSHKLSSASPPAPVLNLGTSIYAKMTTLKINTKCVLKSCPMGTNLLTWPLSLKNHGWDTFQQQQGKGEWYKNTSKPVNS